MQRVLALLVIIGLVAAVRPVHAEAPAPARAVFAIVIGSNASVDAELPALRFADDDAARYVDLFRLLGARTYLLTRLDANTARLHVQAAAEAVAPRRAELERTIAQAAADVAQAHARGVETQLYFIYAGHGSVRNGQGYITLEDARLTGADLATKVVGVIPADRFHVIIDACDSFLLAYPRGPGGVRRPVEGFQEARGLADDERVGLLLSSSSSRESHEWEGFQSGVFSHEVRSGLYGAADADGNGEVSYREIAAFVARANGAIPNERFRPQVHARAPKASQALLDLRGRIGRRLEIDGTHSGHYVIEDARGVRIAELHSAPGTTARILRGAPTGHEYVRRLDDDREFTLPADVEVVSIADLSPEDPRVASRGAAHEAFNLVFSLPFDAQSVLDVSEAPWATSEKPSRPAERSALDRRTVGWGALALGGVGLAVGASFAVASNLQSSNGSPTESQRDAADRNSRIKTYDAGAVVGLSAGGAAAVTGLVLLLWPRAPVAARASATGAGLDLVGHF